MPDYNTLAMLAPDMVASMQRPVAPAPRKRGIFDRLFGVGIPDGLLSDEDRKGARKRALLMAGLGTMAAGSRPGANLGGALATGLMGGLQGGMEAYQQAAEGGMMQQKAMQSQQVEQARQAIYQKYPPAPGETPIQMLQRYGRMLPEFMRIGDTEMVGKLTELLKSVGGPAFGIERPETPKDPAREVGTGPDGKLYYFERTPTGEWKNTGLLAKQDKPAAAAGGDRDTPTGLTQTSINQILDDHEGRVKVVKTAAEGYGTLMETSELAGNNPIASMGILYAYIKLIDPGSVVREGEYNALMSRASWDRQLQRWLKKAQDGALPAADVRDIKAAGAANARQWKARAKEEFASTRKRAALSGVRPERLDEFMNMMADPWGRYDPNTATMPRGNAAAVDSILRR